MSDISFAESFFDYFDILTAESNKHKEACYQLRHSVYAEEMMWEPIHPSRLEQDAYDSYSEHILMKHLRTRLYAGTIRLIRQNPDTPDTPFPFEHYCSTSFYREIVNIESLSRDQIGEISRIAVSPSFRKRAGEASKAYDVTGYKAAPSTFSDAERRHFLYISIGLFLAIATLAQQRGLTHTFALLEPNLAQRLDSLGFDFKQCGPSVEVRGQRAPYVIEMDHFESHLSADLYALYKQINERL